MDKISSPGASDLTTGGTYAFPAFPGLKGIIYRG
jgi:hypothetical protein